MQSPEVEGFKMEKSFFEKCVFRVGADAGSRVLTSMDW